MACRDRTSGNDFKPKDCGFGLERRKKFFYRCKKPVVRQWNRLSGEAVDALSLGAFKVSLDGALGNLI